MASIDTIFTRRLLKAVHAELRKQFPEIRNVVQCVGVTNTMRGGNRQWFVQIDTPGRPIFNYDCRAYSATEARYKGWNAWLKQYGRADEAA